jgi:transcriptional regulator with XRE-family HTH domain
MPAKIQRKTVECKNFLMYPLTSFSCNVFPAMDSAPYHKEGQRLKNRRKALQDSKVLSTVAAIAESCGVTASAYNQYENGKIWPKPTTKAKLAALMKWTVQELDYGPPTAARGGQEMLHPVTTQEAVLLALFGKLNPDRRLNLMDQLKAEVMTINAMQPEIRGEIRPVPDPKVAQPTLPVPRAKAVAKRR